MEVQEAVGAAIANEDKIIYKDIPLIQHHRNLINKLFRCRPVALEGHHVPDRLCISIMMIESFINRSLHLL